MQSFDFLLGHLLSSHANFPEKLAILTPWRVHAFAYQTVKIDSFSENVSSVLTKWPPSSLIFISLKVWLDNRLNKHIRYFLQRLMSMTLLNSKIMVVKMFKKYLLGEIWWIARSSTAGKVSKWSFSGLFFWSFFTECPNTGKYGPEKLRIWMLFRQCRYYQISRFSSFTFYF